MRCYRLDYLLYKISIYGTFVYSIHSDLHNSSD